MFRSTKSLQIPAPHDCLPGRAAPIVAPGVHEVLGSPLDLAGTGVEVVALGLGCFWGAERLYWRVKGVRSTAVGYAAGTTPNPTYEEVCSGATGHAEVVRVAFDPQLVSLEQLLVVFWEGHDPTQSMRQGNDVGTQYRSCVLTTTAEQRTIALASRESYAASLSGAGFGAVTTSVEPLTAFFFAETYHQQYLHKNPAGYCGLRGTGVRCVS
jgi:peptide-methionine (S)-S-oxide reductase